MESKPEWRCGSCMFNQEGECLRIKGPQHEYEDDDVLGHDIVRAYDGSGDLAGLEVKDDFGCVLWKPKDLG